MISKQFSPKKPLDDPPHVLQFDLDVERCIVSIHATCEQAPTISEVPDNAFNDIVMKLALHTALHHWKYPKA